MFAELKLPYGIPSHDMINQAYSALYPRKPETCFIDCMKDVCQLPDGEFVSIEGKYIPGSKKPDPKRWCIW